MSSTKVFENLSEQLAVIPVPNEAARIIKNEKDLLSIEVQLRYSPMWAWLAKLFLLKTKKIYELEGLGLLLYRRLDSAKTLGELIDQFQDENALTFFEARALILQYLQSLMKSGLVVMAARKKNV